MKPTLITQFRLAALLQSWFGWERLGFEHLRFQAHKHSSGQKGFAAVGQILLVAATSTLKGSDHLPGHGDPLMKLIEKAIDHGDDIHIPGIEITPLRSILQQTDGQARPPLGFADQPGS